MVENQVSFRHVPHVEKGHNHVSTRAPGVVALSQLRHLSGRAHARHARRGGRGVYNARRRRRAAVGAALSRGVFPRGALELDRTARARIYLPHLTDRYRLALGSVSRQTQPRAHLHLRRAHAGPAGALSIENISQRERGVVEVV